MNPVETKKVPLSEVRIKAKPVRQWVDETCPNGTYLKVIKLQDGGVLLFNEATNQCFFL